MLSRVLPAPRVGARRSAGPGAVRRRHRASGDIHRSMCGRLLPAAVRRRAGRRPTRGGDQPRPARRRAARPRAQALPGNRGRRRRPGRLPQGLPARARRGGRAERPPGKSLDVATVSPLRRRAPPRGEPRPRGARPAHLARPEPARHHGRRGRRRLASSTRPTRPTTRPTPRAARPSWPSSTPSSPRASRPASAARSSRATTPSATSPAVTSWSRSADHRADPGERAHTAAAAARSPEGPAEHGATTIFFETLVSPEVAETLAKEIGAKTAVLDPLEGLAGGQHRRLLFRHASQSRKPFVKRWAVHEHLSWTISHGAVAFGDRAGAARSEPHRPHRRGRRDPGCQRQRQVHPDPCGARPGAAGRRRRSSCSACRSGGSASGAASAMCRNGIGAGSGVPATVARGGVRGPAGPARLPPPGAPTDRQAVTDAIARSAWPSGPAIRSPPCPAGSSSAP